MGKKQNLGVKSNKVATPKVGASFLSRHHLANLFGLPEKKLLYAVAEISYNDGQYIIKPIVANIDTDTYIDLLDGQCKKGQQAAGFKFDLYLAIVRYNEEKETFVFKSSSLATVEVPVAKLVENFGKGVVVKAN